MFEKYFIFVLLLLQCIYFLNWVNDIGIFFLRIMTNLKSDNRNGGLGDLLCVCPTW